MKHTNPKQYCPRARLESGLSLIELMISVTIGLLILAALSTLFINQSKSRVELDKSNRMIDNGRYALELLSGNLRLAGFYDNFNTYNLTSPSTTLYDPCDLTSLTDPAIDLSILLVPVQGYNAATPASQAASPPCSATLTYTGSNPTLKVGSDILTVRRASTAVSASTTSGVTYFQVSMCQTDAYPGNYQLLTAPAASFASVHKKDCASIADIRAFMVTTYYISPNNIVGDGIPTLKQIDQYGTVTPLVEGIEYMQIDYGVDDSGDGTADRYTDCAACSFADWTNIVSVRVSLIARNTESTAGWSDNKTYDLGLDGTVGPLNDGYKRHVYTQVVRLDNPSGRREAP